MYLEKPPGYNFKNFAKPFLVSFTNWLAYSEMKMESKLCLKLFRKSIKTHVAG